MTQTTQCPQGGDGRVKRSQDGAPCKHVFVAQHVNSVAVGTSKEFWPVLGQGVGKAFRKKNRNIILCVVYHICVYICVYMCVCIYYI